MSPFALVFDLNKTGYAVVRCLHRAAVPVTGLHAVPYVALAAGSNYLREPLVIPSATESETLAALETLVEREGGPAVVMCATDQAVDFVSRHRARLGRRFLLPDAAIPLHELLDKDVQGEVAARAGIAVPPQVLVRRDTGDLDGALAEIPLPAFVKPGNSLYGYKSKMGIEATREGLRARVEATLRACATLLVSAYVPGTAAANYAVMALGRRDGGVTIATVTRKLRQYPADGFGSGTLVETCRDDELVALATAFVREAGLIGPVEVEFKREHGDGRPWFLEANLRYSGQAEMTAAAGANLPYLAFLDALGAPLPAVPANPARVLWVDELRDWVACASGEIALDALLREYADVTLLPVYAADDPAPFEHARRNALDEAGEHRALCEHVLGELVAASARA